MQHTADYLTFGQWRYLRTIGQLQPLSASADPEVLTLEPRLHKLLNFFLDHKDLVVSREQILSGVWGEGLGSDESLTRAIAGSAPSSARQQSGADLYRYFVKKRLLLAGSRNRN